jgi:hypothetical protein
MTTEKAVLLRFWYYKESLNPDLGQDTVLPKNNYSDIIVDEPAMFLNFFNYTQITYSKQ